jgi:hypothetical protein
MLKYFMVFRKISVSIAYNGLALGDVAKQSGLSSIGKIDFFREKNIPAS